jgi:hypothetical protein
MNAWKRSREARQARKRQKAYDRLHGRGAVSVPPRRRRKSEFDADDLGELIGDILLALPRAVIWLASKFFD